MLVLSRRTGESIEVGPADGLDPTMTVAELFAQGPVRFELLGGTGRRVKVGIEAPRELQIRRKDETALTGPSASVNLTPSRTSRRT